MKRFVERIGGDLAALEVRTLQVNLGYRCNLACRHCHVEAGPGRRETMDDRTIDAVVGALAAGGIEELDLTGGEPTLGSGFRRLVETASGMGVRVKIRTNLAVMREPGMGFLPGFLEKHRAHIVGSLPCYLEENVDQIRGRGVFTGCIEALRRLNDMGYGSPGSGLVLDLVYNPMGAFLPPPEAALEADYKKRLGEGYGIVFNRLYALLNMPIGRFKTSLERTGKLGEYLEMLESAYNPATLCGVMCRHLVSVGWDGRLFDCDFNQMAGMGISEGFPTHISDFNLGSLAVRKINLGDHCYGCTAGQGFT